MTDELHDPPGVEVSLHGEIPEDLVEAETSTARRSSAAANRARFEGVVRGAKERTGYLRREDIEQLAYGVTDLMLVHIITGRLKPGSAKEGIDVAKAALEIARKMGGEVDTSIVIRTPEERANAMAALKEIALTVQARQVEAGQGPPPEDIIDVGEAPVLDPELVRGAQAVSIPPPARVGRTLTTVRP